MAARKKKKKTKPSKQQSSKARALIRRSLSSYLKALPAVAVVGLIGLIPMQLAMTWLLIRQGILGDTVWEWRYQGLIDWVLGSLITPALYLTVHRSIAEGPPAARELFSWLGWAYRRAVTVWVGMFMTRMMVSFVIMLPALPVVGGFFLITRQWPELSRVMSDPTSASSVTPTMFLPLLLLVPLLALPLFIYLRYALTEVVVSLERTDGFQALQRSKALTKGAKWKLLWGMVALDFPVFAVSLIVEGFGGELNPWVNALVSAVAMLLIVLPGTFLVHVYLSQGGDAEDRRRAPAPDKEPDAASS